MMWRTRQNPKSLLELLKVQISNNLLLFQSANFGKRDLGFNNRAPCQTNDPSFTWATLKFVFFAHLYKAMMRVLSLYLIFWFLFFTDDCIQVVTFLKDFWLRCKHGPIYTGFLRNRWLKMEEVLPSKIFLLPWFLSRMYEYMHPPTEASIYHARSWSIVSYLLHFFACPFYMGHW